MSSYIVSLLFLSFLAIYTNSKELCKSNNYVAGYWKPVNVTKKLYYCCQNDDVGQVESCGAQVIHKEGYFRYDELIIASNEACSCDLVSNTRNSASPREKYEWEPDDCYLEPFNSSHFCELLDKRRILLIGDSLTHQVSTVLVSILRAQNASCVNQISHGKSSNLIFGYNGPKNFHIHFKDNNGADICIMNAGSHLEDEGDVYSIWDTLPKWLGDMKVIRKQLSRSWSSIHIFISISLYLAQNSFGFRNFSVI